MLSSLRLLRTSNKHTNVLRCATTTIVRNMSEITSVPLSAHIQTAEDQQIISQVASSWKGVKRFYQNVKPSKIADDKWQVLIDGRPLRTNAMNDLILPSMEMALAIAGEFAGQQDMVIPATTPLYTLASTAIDTYVTEDLKVEEDIDAEGRAYRLSVFDRIQALQTTEGIAKSLLAKNNSIPSVDEIIAETKKYIEKNNETNKNNNYLNQRAEDSSFGREGSGAMTVGGASGTNKLRDLVLDNLETDTICYRVDLELADPSERLLRKRQDKHYDPLMSWFKDSYGIQLASAEGFQDIHHPNEAYEVAEDVVDTANPWVKAAMQQSIGAVKSSVISLAFLHRFIDIDGAFEAARVEEEWQIGENGFVEDGHDTGRSYLKTQLASIAAYMWLLPASYRMKALPNPISPDYKNKLQASIEERKARVARRRLLEKELVDKKRAILKENILREAAEDIHSKLASKQMQ